MKFQFSLARLLMATAMVALTFGLARMMLGKEISSFAIFVGVLAADLGLLVLAAQKKGDLYRILRVITVVLAIIFIYVSIFSTAELISARFYSRLLPVLGVVLPLAIIMIFLSVFFSKRINKIERKANASKEEVIDQSLDSRNP
jgi:L-lactate permease